ncbi:MAG: hypothetical protein PHV37_02430 [Candidatus Gastranaerophilales bacterium]|nr:hypothetical protein [Candidatus Gastranaerophilales bacterium]
MKKSLIFLFTIALTMGCISTQTTANAATNDNLFSGSAILKDLKEGVKKDLESAADATKKSRVTRLQTERNEKLAPINKEIAAKKVEIAQINKAKTTETERALKLIKANHELQALEAKRDRVKSFYDKQIEASK